MYNIHGGDPLIHTHMHDTIASGGNVYIYTLMDQHSYVGVEAATGW